MAKPSQQDPQFKLRMTLEIKEKLVASANENNRSLNAEILDRLEKSFKSNDQNLTEVLRGEIETTVIYTLFAFLQEGLLKVSPGDAIDTSVQNANRIISLVDRTGTD